MKNQIEIECKLKNQILLFRYIEMFFATFFAIDLNWPERHLDPWVKRDSSNFDRFKYKNTNTSTNKLWFKSQIMFLGQIWLRENKIYVNFKLWL